MPPILLLLFNRPDLTRILFEALERVRPERLYLAADGPRDNCSGEDVLCAQVRQIASGVHWPCEVKTRFLDRNEGCRMAVSGAISWFFENELEGIILEDDCVPDDSFFNYCAELLNHYRDDPRVMSISGTLGFSPLKLGKHLPVENSFVFSKNVHVWGWASWRRAWNLYDIDMRDWPTFRDNGHLKRLSHRQPTFEHNWTTLIDWVYKKEVDTWDIQWVFAHWQHDCLSCIPKYNLVKNVGFRPDATHANSLLTEFANRPIEPMQFPIIYPDSVCLDQDFERAYDGEEPVVADVSDFEHVYDGEAPAAINLPSQPSFFSKIANGFRAALRRAPRDGRGVQ